MVFLAKHAERNLTKMINFINFENENNFRHFLVFTVVKTWIQYIFDFIFMDFQDDRIIRFAITISMFEFFRMNILIKLGIFM